MHVRAHTFTFHSSMRTMQGCGSLLLSRLQGWNNEHDWFICGVCECKGGVRWMLPKLAVRSKASRVDGTTNSTTDSTTVSVEGGALVNQSNGL